MASDRRAIIAGNWKMYKTIPQAESFVERLAPAISNLSVGVYLAVPFTAIFSVSKKAEGTRIVIGAQNMNDASEGAFTGEIAASMLIDAGARFVILGHSERRHIFGENNDFIHRKVLKAVASGLQVILCVGETVEEREAGRTEEVLKKQLSDCLAGLSEKDMKSMIIAYEPVWAIGTGKTATSEMAEKEHREIRTIISELYSADTANKVSILYGGSVNTSNSKELVLQPDIDGLLVGGGSLSTGSFAEILRSVTMNKVEI